MRVQKKRHVKVNYWCFRKRTEEEGEENEKLIRTKEQRENPNSISTLNNNC